MEKVLSPEGKQFWLHLETMETRWTTPFGVEVSRPDVHEEFVTEEANLAGMTYRGKPQVIETTIVQSSTGTDRKSWEKAIRDE